MVTTRARDTVLVEDASQVSGTSTPEPISPPATSKARRINTTQPKDPKRRKDRKRKARKSGSPKSANGSTAGSSGDASPQSSSGRSDDSVKEKLKKTTIDATQDGSDRSEAASSAAAEDATMTSTPEKKTMRKGKRKSSEIKDAVNDLELKGMGKRAEDSPPPRKRRSRSRSTSQEQVIGITAETNEEPDTPIVDAPPAADIKFSSTENEPEKLAVELKPSTNENGLEDRSTWSPSRRERKRPHDMIAANLSEKTKTKDTDSDSSANKSDKKLTSRPPSRGPTGEPPEKKAKDTPSVSPEPKEDKGLDIKTGVPATEKSRATASNDKEEVQVEVTKTAFQLRPGSGFANTSAISPFGQPVNGSSTANIFAAKPTTSSSSTTSSFGSFGAAAAATSSPFGTLGGGPAATALPFGTFGVGAATTPSPFSTLGGSTSIFSKSSVFGASPFATTAGTTSIFASAAQPAPLSIVPLGAKVKPFGAPDTDDEKSDNEGADDEENEDAASTINVDIKGAGLGEENEDSVYQVHTKLYKFESNKWAERGMGALKLLVEKEKYEKDDDDDEQATDKKKGPRKARLVMRQTGVGRVILNVALFAAMGLQQDDRVVRFWVPEITDNGDTRTVRTAFRLSTSDNAATLIETIKEYLPAQPEPN